VKNDSLLVPAIKADDLKAVKYALSKGEDPNQTQKTNFTCFQYACNFGNFDIVSELLKAGAEIESRETWLGRTPLMLAVVGVKPKTVELLIASGADVNAITTKGTSVLGFATHHLALAQSDGNSKDEIENAKTIVEMLKKAGAKN